jgi:hypothetical protein
MPPNPKRTTSRRSNDAPTRRKPRQPKLAETPVLEAVRPAPAPPPAPAPTLPPVSERWTIGTALVVVAVALAAVFAAFGLVRLLTGDDGLELDAGQPIAASASELTEYAKDHGPVYWIGPPRSGTLEVTRTTGGVYVRYLKPGVAVGDKSPQYTTIATYPRRGAYQEIQRSAGSKAFDSARVDSGALAVWRKSAGTSVYLAHPNRPYLIEVYDPSAQRARSLALSGVVQDAG